MAATMDSNLLLNTLVRISRCCIGIGPPPKDRDLKEFVLGEFSAQEEKVLKDVISKAVAASICFLTEGVDVVMNKYNK